MDVTEVIISDGQVWKVEPGLEAITYDAVATAKAVKLGNYWAWVEQQGGSTVRLRTYRNISTARDIQLGYSRLRKMEVEKMDELRAAVEAYYTAVDTYKAASDTEIVSPVLGLTEQYQAALRVNIATCKVLQAATGLFPQAAPAVDPEARFILMRTSTPMAYKYDHNVEVEVEGDYRIIQCPSTYLARYQIGRFASGMETASQGIFETVALARREAVHLMQREY